MDTKAKLRSEYRKTWETFSRHMKAVHELAGIGEAAAVEAAMREADLAMAAHQDARNNLAAVLVPGLPKLGTNQLQGQNWQKCGMKHLPQVAA